jgi:hypothetical protein
VNRNSNFQVSTQNISRQLKSKKSKNQVKIPIALLIDKNQFIYFFQIKDKNTIA